jgi:glyoxylate/hydroxypyruvate reductase A
MRDASRAGTRRLAVSVGWVDTAQVLALFAAALPDMEVVDAVSAEGDADYIVAGVRDERLFASRRTPKAVFSFGAGVNGVLSIPNLPPDAPLIRLEDAGMTAQMVRYVLAAALRVFGRFDTYARQQRDSVWLQHEPRTPASFAAGVLGIGVIGGAIARALAAQGFRVRGHARTQRTLAGVECHAGDAALDGFLSGLDFLVAVVPLTPATRGMLNRRALAKLADGAHLVNIGRGGLVNDADLIALLDKGKLSGATLDVFDEEPLPQEHPFWARADVALTPHVSGTTLPHEAVAQIAAKIRRLEQGLPVTGVVDRMRGY